MSKGLLYIHSFLHSIVRGLIKHKIVFISLSSATSPFLFSDFIGERLKVSLFTFSSCIRQMIIIAVPFVIFPYIVNSILFIGKKGRILFLIISFGIICSNILSIIVPYFVGYFTIPFINTEKIQIDIQNQITPYFSIDFSLPFGIEVVTLFSVLFGLILSYNGIEKSKFLEKYSMGVTKAFDKGIPWVLPIYICGSMIDIINKIEIKNIVSIFFQMILLVIILQVTYLLLMFTLAEKGRFSRICKSIKNALEPAFVGFTTMSSIVTMPVTIKAAEKNINDSELAKVVITSTVNSHDVGECLFLSTATLTIFFMYTSTLPELSMYSLFAVTLALAQLGGLSIPGGGSLIIIPILSSHLGFTAEMTNLIIVLTILMDPWSTANNIMGNSAFVIFVKRLFSSSSREPPCLQGDNPEEIRVTV